MRATVAAGPQSSEDVFVRIAARLAPTLDPDALDITVAPLAGDHSLNDWDITPEFLRTARTAAVLVGLVPRADGVHVLLTQRTASLRDHAGQFAFPGGKMDPEDGSPAATAIREAHEEIGLPPGSVQVLGYLGAYLTRTGFRIIPVVARLTPPFALVLNAAEVSQSFEVPLQHLMLETNYQLRSLEGRGVPRRVYAIEHDGRTIWGITAGILRVLHEKLYA